VFDAALCAEGRTRSCEQNSEWTKRIEVWTRDAGVDARKGLNSDQHTVLSLEGTRNKGVDLMAPKPVAVFQDKRAAVHARDCIDQLFLRKTPFDFGPKIHNGESVVAGGELCRQSTE